MLNLVNSGFVLMLIGKDMLGTPKIIGWTYIETPAIRSTKYVDENSYKLNNKGEYGRFIHLRSITRIFRDAEAGRLPSSMTIGTASANCYGSEYSINCTITPAQTITTPGKLQNLRGFSKIIGIM